MLQLEILEEGRVVFETAASGPLEIGRRDLARQEPAPFQMIPLGERQRLIIVDAERNLISRRHVTLTQQGKDRVAIRNETANSLLLCGTEAALQPLEPQTVIDIPLPATLVLPDDLRIQVRAEETQLQSLWSVTRAPGVTPPPHTNRMQHTVPPSDVVSADGFFAESLLLLLQRLSDGFQLQSDSREAQRYAAAQLVELLGGVSGRVLVPNDGWREVAMTQRNGGDSAPAAQPPLEELLQHVAATQRTLWKKVRPAAGEATAAEGMVIAAPVLDRDGKLRAVIYAELDRAAPLESAANDRATAQLVELVATGLAACLVRIQQQEDVQRRKQMFEQFFGAKLTLELDRTPDLLSGRDAEVSVLFCDLRGFSRISETLGTVATFEWIQSVMTALTECVADEDGVLLDYVGDELIAMWGAPSTTPDHALRAVRTGQKMLACLPALNAEWRDRLGTDFSLGIGINSGPVRVGNIGSEQKFKYGPLGNTVNVASRIQGLNKQFDTTLLISKATRQSLPTALPSRRLGSFRVVGIEQPIQLYEVAPLKPTADWLQLQGAYETALEQFERCEFTTVLELLSVALRTAVSDRPSLLLLSRAATALSEGPAADHPVWTVSEK